MFKGRSNGVERNLVEHRRAIHDGTKREERDGVYG